MNTLSFNPSAKRTSLESALLIEHTLWVAHAAKRPGPMASDLRLLLAAMQNLLADKKGMPQITRDEVMDVLRRTGEESQGFDFLSMVRAARALADGTQDSADAAQFTSPARSPDPALFLQSIAALEKKNKELMARLSALQSALGAAQPDSVFTASSGARPFPAPVGGTTPASPAVKRPQNISVLQWITGLIHWLFKSKNEVGPTVFSENGFPMDALKTIVLTMHGQVDTKSLYEVTSDWSTEKLRSRRVLRAWTEGQTDEVLAESGASECRFGQWLDHVDPPTELRRQIEDLRMWHDYWHTLAHNGSRCLTVEDKAHFARAVVAGAPHHDMTVAARRIDRLLMEVAQVARGVVPNYAQTPKPDVELKVVGA